MKIVSIIIVHLGEVAVSAFNVDSFGYFQRGKVKEWAVFFSKTLLKNTEIGQRQDVRHEDYLCRLYKRTADLGIVSMTDTEYPQRVIYSMMNKILDEFIGACSDILEQARVVSKYPYAGLEEHLQRYQDPATADTLTRVQNELDETKVVLHDAIEACLDRGQRLDDLIEKSEDLSAASKAFYKSARKLNRRCCSIQ